ncbi:MAK10-like protein [Tanacetum coccineum]
MFQQHQGASLSEAWTRFNDLLQKVPHHGIDLWLQVQIFYDHALIEDLALYDNKSWNGPRDFTKLVKAISLPHDVPNASDHRLIELENQWSHDTQYCIENTEQAFVDYASSRIDEAGESLELGKNGSVIIQGEMPKKIKDPGLFTLPCRLGDSKPFDTLVDLGSCLNLISLYLFKKIKVGLLEETENVLGLADRTKSYPVGIVRNVEVHIGKLKLLEDFYVIDMERDPTCPLLVRRRFLATASAVIDYKKAKIATGEGITRSIFGVKEIYLGAEDVPNWTTLGKRESYEPRPSTDRIDLSLYTIPRSRPIDLESAQNNALVKLPLLKQGDYDTWRLRIESYIQLQDYALWEILEDGNSFKPVAQTTTNADGTSTSTIPDDAVTAEEKIQKKNDLKA